MRSSSPTRTASSRVSSRRPVHIPRATASFAKRSGYRGAHQKAAVESVQFPLWTYNPTTGKVKLDSADKSDTVSFAYPPLVGGSRSARTHPKRKRGRANAVSKELGEDRFKQLVKKIGQDKAMEMLKGATL